MKTNSGSIAGASARKALRSAVLIGAICAAGLAVTSCVEHPRPYAGYYSAGYAAPYGYGYGYGNPYYGYPYGGAYGYGGAPIIISGAHYHGYHSPYYGSHYYPHAQVQRSTMAGPTAGVIAQPHASGRSTRSAHPRTQATLPR